MNSNVTQLVQEIERLRAEIQVLREQRRQLLDTFVPGRHKHFAIDDEEILRNVGAKPTFQQLLADLEKPVGK
jgi:hypothetical protein